MLSIVLVAVGYPQSDWSFDASVLTSTSFTVGNSLWSSPSAATYQGVEAWDLNGPLIAAAPAAPPLNSGILIPENYTHAYWVYFSVTGGSWRPGLNGPRSDGTDGNTFCVFVENEDKLAVMGDDGGETSTHTIVKGEWQFVLMTASGGSTTFYVDDGTGVPSSVGSVGKSCSGVAVRAIPASGQSTFGHVALIQGWNRVLSEEEIVELHADTRCTHIKVDCPPTAPPPSAPPPSPPPYPPGAAPAPPPRLASVGDDPLFVGGDGLQYEVRGTPGAVFNVLSTPVLSINGQFLAVPPRFKGVDITDTVLGAVGVALCDSNAAVGALTFATDGALSLVAADGSISAHTVSGGGGAGWSLRHSRLVCDLKAMSCSWRPHDGAPLRLPEYDGGHSRIHLTTATADVVITRNAMVDLGTETEIDCADFKRWPAAARACAAVMTRYHEVGGAGISGGASTQETLLLLAGPRLRSEQRFHFMDIALTRLEFAQSQVHGLLGQRALLKGANATKAVTASASLAGRVEAEQMFGPQGEGAIEGEYSEYIMGTLGEHGGGRFTRFLHCL